MSDDDTILDNPGQNNTPTTQFAIPQAETEIDDVDPEASRKTDAVAIDMDSAPTTERELGHLRYELLERIGGGSMADVYLARDILMSTPTHTQYVAVKLFTPNNPYFADEFEDRIRIEVRAAQEVSSPYVCRVHNLIRTRDGEYGIPMALVVGKTLTQLLQEGLDVDYVRIARWGAEIAEGLAVAHDRNIVHRDLKPGNIMIRKEDDQVVILDFGVARFFLQDSITKQGRFLGTPLFMAPEQFECEADPRSDLFALGIILALLITGRVPLATGRLPHQVYQDRVLNFQEYRLWDEDSDAPLELARVVDKLLRQAPDDRFQTGWEVAQALRAFISSAQADTWVPLGPAPRSESLGVGEETLCIRARDLELDAIDPAPRQNSDGDTKRIFVRRPSTPAVVAEPPPRANIISLIALSIIFALTLLLFISNSLAAETPSNDCLQAPAPRRSVPPEA